MKPVEQTLHSLHVSGFYQCRDVAEIFVHRKLQPHPQTACVKPTGVMKLENMTFSRSFSANYIKIKLERKIYIKFLEDHDIVMFSFVTFFFFF